MHRLAKNDSKTFETFIDGIKYTFKVKETILINPNDRFISETYPSVYGGFAFGYSEEEAILKLVKFLEK